MNFDTARNVAFLGLALSLAACDIPDSEYTQQGYRGTAMVNVQDASAPMGEVAYPAALPAAPSTGPKAGDVYENVQVLGDLSVAEFTRLMTSITEWVSPEQGCNYCHQGNNFANDDMYTKVVSRRMIQMTQHVNAEWETHVGQVGVNCFTCHRGKNVPEYIWFEEGDAAYGNAVATGWRDGQNRPSETVGMSSLPTDMLLQYLTVNDNNSVRLGGNIAGVPGSPDPGIKAAEHTYGLMMNWSTSLGVNCTQCHNSRAFKDWEQSSPARVTAHHGLNMVRDLNSNYLIPLGPVYPANRLGQEIGDAPKAYCATCHQGQSKPLAGSDAITAYPSLAKN